MANSASSTSLCMRHIFGVSSSVTDNLSFADEDTLAYVAGHSIVLHTLKDNRQRFIQSQEITGCITAYTSGPGKRLAALAERCDKPALHVFDLRTCRRKKTLHAVGLQTKEIVSMQFSEDDQYLLALSGAPDWSLMVFHWQRAKLIASIPASLSQTPLTKCFFSPLDSSLVSVIGKDCVKFFRLNEKDFRPLQDYSLSKIVKQDYALNNNSGFSPSSNSYSYSNSSNFNCTCFTWMRNPDDHLLVGTEEGAIFLFRSGEFVTILGCSPGISHGIKSLVSLPGGIGIGTIHSSQVMIYAYDESKDQVLYDNQFKLAMNLSVNELAITSSTQNSNSNNNGNNNSTNTTNSISTPLSSTPILSLAMCPKQERLVCLTQDTQILGITLPSSLAAIVSGSSSSSNSTNSNSSNSSVSNNNDNSSGNDSPTATTTCPINTTLKPLIAPFHGGRAITGLDVAVKKPLIATVSKDLTFKIWNFQKHTLEFSKTFPEEMTCVSLHPSGLHCAIGFNDKLKIFHILMDDLRCAMEVPVKSCRECKFTNGGSMIAVTSGNFISIFNTYTGEKILDLRGHNNKVKSLHWMNSDCHLLSCGMDGAVYLWDIDGGRRCGEYIQKGTVFTSVANSSNSVLVVDVNCVLRELSLPDLVPSKYFEVTNESRNTNLMNVAISLKKNVVFTATSENNMPSYIRLYPYPLNGEYDAYAVTSGPTIQKMVITLDENFLICGDDSGCVFVYELHGRQERFHRAGEGSSIGNSQFTELITLSDWSDEVIVTSAELEDCTTALNELQTKIEELKLNNEYQLKLKDMNHLEQIKEIESKYNQELELAKSRYDLLSQLRVDYELESLEKMKLMEENHQTALQGLETTYQAQIMKLVDDYQNLVRQRDVDLLKLDKGRKEIVSFHEEYVAKLIKENESKLEADRQNRIQAQEQLEQLKKELDEIQNQLDDDIKIEINLMKDKHDDHLTSCREMTLKYKGENGILKKKTTLLQAEIEEQTQEIKNLLSREKHAHDVIKQKEDIISNLKKEIKSRDTTIQEKEKRIYELKKKNQELDKFKFVLDFKIRELKQQIEPKQLEITNMREKIKQMDNELAQYHKSNSLLDNLIGELQEKIQQHQEECKNIRTNAKNLENTIEQCRSDIQFVMQFIQNPSSLLSEVEKLVKKYKTNDEIKLRIDPLVEEEYSRHKQFLQNSINEMKKIVTAKSQQHMSINHEMREKNMNLINEINIQREANKNLKNIIQAEVGKIRHYLQNNGLKKRAVSAPNSSIENSTNNINKMANNKGDANESLDALDLLTKNSKRIAKLKQVYCDLQAKVDSIAAKAAAYSLPPIPITIGTKDPEKPEDQMISLPPILPVKNLVLDDLTPRHAGLTYATELRETK